MRSGSRSGAAAAAAPSRSASRVRRRAPCGHTEGRYGRTVGSIDEYSFGRIIVDGTEHRRDLIVTPDRVVPNWWRKDGHSLAIEDLDEVIDELPERLVLGCGAHGRLKPDPAVIAALERRGVSVEALPT